jgi:hypothetical protein
VAPTARNPVAADCVGAAGLSLQNGAERGWVLKGVEEINLLLEDMGLNLQSMMASPHVRPFAEEVRNWEQRLSLIGEAIEVCSCRSTPIMLVGLDLLRLADAASAQ